MAVEARRSDGHAVFARFSDGEYQKRYIALRAAMTERGLDALIIWGESSGWGELSGGRIGMANAWYLSNFADQLREYVLLPREANPVLFTFSRSHSTCAREISVVEIEYGHANIAASVVERLKQLGLEAGRIGLVGSSTLFGQSLPVDQYRFIRLALPDAQLTIATDMLESARAQKSDEEMEWLRRAADFTDQAFAAVVSTAAPSIPEYLLHERAAAAYLDQGGHMHYQALGATSMTSPSLVSPSYHKSRRSLQSGDVIVAELSAGYWGYGGYLARPIAVGEAPTPAYRECFDLAVSIFESLSSILRPGAAVATIRSVLERAFPTGWDNLVPVLRGWGLGPEPPVVDSRAMPLKGAESMVLAPGMVIAVAVNPVLPDGRTGLRIADLFAINDTGIQRLHKTPLEFFHA